MMKRCLICKKPIKYPNHNKSGYCSDCGRKEYLKRKGRLNATPL
jgi:rRNA maturation endonuclease Nob1